MGRARFWAETDVEMRGWEGRDVFERRRGTYWAEWFLFQDKEEWDYGEKQGIYVI